MDVSVSESPAGNSSLGFYDLPPEILLHIFTFLPLKSKVLLQQVCRYTKSLVLSSRQLYRNLCFNDRSTSYWLGHSIYMSKAGQPVGKIFEVSNCGVFNGYIFRDIPSNCFLSTLLRIDISGSSVSDDAFISIWCGSIGVLKELVLMECLHLTGRIVIISQQHTSLQLIQFSSHLKKVSAGMNEWMNEWLLKGTSAHKGHLVP